MRKFIVSVAVATAALAAVPAAAQYQDRPNWNQRGPDRDGWDQRGPNYRAVNQLHRELAEIEQRIQRSLQRGFISPREAFSLRRQANQIRNRLHRASRNGLTGREFSQLRFQVNQLRQNVREERRDRDRRRG